MAGEAMDHHTDDTAALVERARSGDERAFGELYDLWFDRAHDLACRVSGDRAVGAEVAQDSFLQAWRALDTLRDPGVFGGWLLRIVRNTAFNRRRVEARTTAVDHEGLAMIGAGAEERVASAEDPATAVADADVVALVRDAVAAMSGRDAEVLDLGLRLGLSPAEIGEAVGLNRNAANQAVHRARRGLRKAVEARVLWRGSRPACPDLEAALRRAGIDAFGATAVPIADAHAARCERCGERRRLRLDPAALFGAIPLVAAPVLLKAKVAAALAAEGVPMAGSAHQPPAPPNAPASAPPAPPTPPAAPPAPPAAPAPSAPRGRSGRRRFVAMGAVVAVVLVAVVLAIATAAGNGDGTASVVASEAGKAVGTSVPPTVLAVPSSTTEAVIAAPTTAAPAAGPAPTRPPAIAPPVADPAPTTTTAAPVDPTTTTVAPTPVDAALVMRPATMSGTWLRTGTPGPPRLVWTTSGAASVDVRGPGVSAATRAGDEPVCPNGTGMWSFCNPPAGTYEYVLTARDAGGAVVAQRTATLEVR